MSTSLWQPVEEADTKGWAPVAEAQGTTPAKSPANPIAAGDRAVAAMQAEPRKMPQSWGDIAPANPFEGGLSGMYSRTAPYLKGDFQGEGQAAVGMAKGIGKTAWDIGRTAGGSYSGTLDLGRDLWGIARGLGQTIAAPFHWSTYSDPKQFGNEAFNLAALLYSPKAKEIPGDVGAKFKALEPKEALQAEAAKRVYEAQAETIQHVKKGEEAYEAITNNKAQAISQADARSGSTIDATQLKLDHLNQQQAFNAAERLSTPKDAIVSQLIDDAGDLSKISFERLKQLRSDIGRQFQAKMSPMENALVTTAYDSATKLLKDRSTSFGMEKEWNAYNSEFAALMNARKGTLGDMKQFRADPTDFFAQFKPTNVVLQNLLDKFEDATDPMGRGRGSGAAVRKITKDIGPINNILTSGEGAGMMSRIGNIMRHPLYGLVGGTLGMIPGQLLSGGRWVGGMIGAMKGSALADRLELADQIVNGPQFPAGKAAVEAGKAGEMLPEQYRTTAKPQTQPQPQTAPKPQAAAIDPIGDLMDRFGISRTQAENIGKSSSDVSVREQMAQSIQLAMKRKKR